MARAVLPLAMALPHSSKYAELTRTTTMASPVPELITLLAMDTAPLRVVVVKCTHFPAPDVVKSFFDNVSFEPA